MSTTAYADGPTQVSTAEEFLAAVNSGGSEQLTADFHLPLDNQLQFEKAMTLDLNGHAITVQKTNMYCYWNFFASITIRDEAGGGKIINPSGTNAFRTSRNGDLTLEGGTLEFTGRISQRWEVFFLWLKGVRAI